MAERKFQLVKTPDEADDSAPQNSVAMSVAASALALGLKTLSQRAIAATKDVFTLLSTGSIFWVWTSIPDPTTTQIVSHSIYAAVILIANVIVRRV